MEPNLAVFVGLLAALALVSFVSSCIQGILFFKVLKLRDPDALESRMSALATAIEVKAQASMDEFRVFKDGPWKSHIGHENQLKRKLLREAAEEDREATRDNGHGRQETPEALAMRLRGD